MCTEVIVADSVTNVFSHPSWAFQEAVGGSIRLLVPAQTLYEEDTAETESVPK
jgi:hypothetical protein